MRTTKFEAMLLKLRDQLKSTPYTLRDIIRGEASAVLAKASERTKQADKKIIERRYTMQRGVKGSAQDAKMVRSVKMSGKRYSTRRRYPNHIFEAIVAKMEKMKNEAVARIASNKASWYIAAGKAGLDRTRFKSIAKLDKAIQNQYRTFSANDEVTGKVHNETAGRYSIRIWHRHEATLNKWAGGYEALSKAIGGRNSFFTTNVNKGVFDSAAKIAAKYPGIKVTLP